MIETEHERATSGTRVGTMYRTEELNFVRLVECVTAARCRFHSRDHFFKWEMLEAVGSGRKVGVGWWKVGREFKSHKHSLNWNIFEILLAHMLNNVSDVRLPIVAEIQ